MGPRPYRSAVRDARTQKTRSRIVGAALEILSSADGAGGLSFDAVAERAGVARMTVYYQFGSRRGLIEATFDEIALRGGLTELPATFQIADPREALRAFVAVFCRFWAQNLAAMRQLYAAAAADPEIEQGIRERNERRRRGLGALVARLDTVKDKRDLVDAIFVLTSAATYHEFSGQGRDADATEALIQDLVNTVIEGCRRDTR